jgi:predicted sulfurtransferase
MVICNANEHQWSIVLFHKYFVSNNSKNDKNYCWWVTQYPDFYVEQIRAFCKQLCNALGLKGRLLIAAEGINGTVSASSKNILEEFINSMENFDLIRDCGLPETHSKQTDTPYDKTVPSRECLLFAGIDWKISTSHTPLEPFPDLKVSVVKEIISTGGVITLEDIERDGGTHLSPEQFHSAIREHPDAVLVDVRNTFEHAIGHFVHPTTQQPAINPETVTFSSFDATFCARNASQLQDKTVLMYCTGGIRCEKASVMLKQRGVKNVYQLSGGIHRYLERFGDDGYFKGKNFVFDQRVTQCPSECQSSSNKSNFVRDATTVVGKCIECCTPFDEMDGSRICTVCRDLVLVCPKCQEALREYHCARHASWKTCYWTFLEVFDGTELLQQKEQLLTLRDTYYVPASDHKNVRRTLSRQIEKVSKRIQALKNDNVMVDRNAPRRCRTCMESMKICDGRCWGFWKTAHQQAGFSNAIQEDIPIRDIQIGDSVQPGSHWNELRLGKPTNGQGNCLRGTVVEVKTWGAGSLVRDCVAVVWQNDPDRKNQSLIYRWGVLSRNGTRMYDVERIPT